MDELWMIFHPPSPTHHISYKYKIYIAHNDDMDLESLDVY
jgi:hypothetical protein